MSKNTLNFGDALNALKQGHKVARSGWNGKGMYVLTIDGGCVRESINDAYGNENKSIPLIDVDNALYLKNVQDCLVAWLPSTGDLFAEDWQIL